MPRSWVTGDHNIDPLIGIGEVVIVGDQIEGSCVGIGIDVIAGIALGDNICGVEGLEGVGSWCCP